MIPPSPTRVELMGAQHPTWNVTGRGGAQSDYRRRTVEYVDSNRRAYAKPGIQTLFFIQIVFLYFRYILQRCGFETIRKQY